MSPPLLQPAGTGTAALLRISRLRIALPQGEIAGITAAAEVEGGDAQPFSVGWVTHANQRWPVYCVSPDLSLLIVIPAERNACVVLAANSGFLGIMCDEAASVEVAPGQRQALPPAMRLPESPVLGLIALEDGEVACASSAQGLAAYVSRLTGS